MLRAEHDRDIARLKQDLAERANEASTALKNSLETLKASHDEMSSNVTKVLSQVNHLEDDLVELHTSRDNMQKSMFEIVERVDV